MEPEESLFDTTHSLRPALPWTSTDRAGWPFLSTTQSKQTRRDERKSSAPDRNQRPRAPTPDTGRVPVVCVRCASQSVHPFVRLPSPL
ncbi:hypothetical protein LZ30DRAFT_704352 [Colletotrichum cereale]|nr:hypothetical protein LZ30DRAFT_704352 [Colletotrichum cereale]